ncbi:hypothetical protein DCAR_0623915 [Daucus carota subsp. sativus]|uniref:FRIGIDA-like protein n=1 Tax=Daucus carota subsp. sativus TaxID=79200 RepID=A0AAF1B613_DAUCS|nr:hypothetical protein DCAR_0623915 [Daucus carota subsp. sativus]
MEKREVEGIREVIEERFEVVRLKGKSIENLEVKLEVIRGNLVEREKEVAMMREVNEKRSKEVASMEEGLVLKEKEIETVKKITHDLCHEVNLQKEKSDLEKREVEERVKELKIREKELEDRLKQFELKEKRIKESVEALDLKKKEMEAKNVPSEERGRRIEIREKKLEKQLKEFELKENPFLCNRNALAFILSNMGAKSLQVFLSENSEDHELLGYDIFNFLKLLKDPAKLVLNTIKGFDTPLLERDKYYESPVFMKSCILLLEQFMKQSPEIEPHVKEDAKKLACNWRVKMRTPVQVLGFLHLISAYGLILSFEVSELERHFEFVSCIKHAPELCQVFRFSDKRPNQTTNFVESLIQKGDRLQAIRYIYEFELVGKFLPVPILKDHLSSKEVMEMSPANIGIISKQLGILRGLVKCIKDHQLEVEYPPEDLLAQIQNLEEKSKEVIERSQSYKNCSKRPHVSGPDPRPEAQSHTNFQKRPAAGLYPRPEAQTQWRISKHPRIEPPARTSSNVPFPAFNPMANFARCEGAYMQSGPEAQRQWHINQLPQARPPGPSLYVQPPLYPMPNFLNTPPAFNPQNAPQS